jgi:hypothetical protein
MAEEAGSNEGDGFVQPCPGRIRTVKVQRSARRELAGTLAQPAFRNRLPAKGLSADVPAGIA